jgi:hypothetical protein
MKFTRLALIGSIAFFTLGAVSVDLSTPKEAAKSVYRAMEAGDADAIQQTLDVGDAVRQPMIAAMADLLVTTKHLSDSARTKFGADAERLGSGSIIPEDIKLLDDAKVLEKDGAATITIANQLAPLVLHKREGGWKLDISDYFAAHIPVPGSNSAEELEKVTRAIAAQTQVLKDFSAELKEVTKDIDANKFSSAADAEVAIQQRFNEVMIKSVKPSTQPATAPAK